ncbi:MAG: S1 RNA-binding domain-containing protein [Catenulispora sp.]|nr:S1 RNA-binding domain-containing protein [Catenulispora sp.]
MAPYQRSDHPELWDFLAALPPGAILAGTVARIENFGVFVALDDGPPHPYYAGVGFITVPELSWRWFRDPRDIVTVGRRVSCEFLQFDDWNLEARLSLRATTPDPFQAFADTVEPGREIAGRVTEVSPLGAFVEVAREWFGLLPGETSLAVGAEVAVVITEIDRRRRTIRLERR